MNLGKNIIITYFKMAAISLLAGLLTLLFYNLLIHIFGTSRITLFFSSFFAYAMGVIANFLMQAINGAHTLTVKKIIPFFAVNIFTATSSSIISSYLITKTGINDDRVSINILYCFVVITMSPLTFYLYHLTLKEKLNP